MPLSVRCERCGRQFSVYAQQLRTRRGRVSCPHCGTRFDGVAALIDEPMTDTEPTSGKLWVAVRLGIGRRRVERADEGHPAQMSRAPRIGPPPRRWRRLGGLLALLALAALLLGWQNRDALRQYPQGRLVLERLCQTLDCTLPPSSATVSVLEPALTPDPAGAGALTLTVKLRNDAPAPQPTPALQLDLFDLAGDLAAARRIDPAGAPPLEPGETRTLRLSIAPPPVEISDFKVRVP